MCFGSLTSCAGAGVGPVLQHYPFLRSNKRDNETGLDYFGARYFTSTQGRFTSVDPVAIKYLINQQDPGFYQMGLCGGSYRTGEKIGAKDGYRIRESIVVETDPSRNNGNIIVAGSPRYEVGLSIGPDLYNPSRFGVGYQIHGSGRNLNPRRILIIMDHPIDK